MLYLAPSEVLEDVIDVLWNITRVITRQVCHGPPYLRHRTHFKLERAFCRSIIFKVQNMKAWKAEGVEHDCSRGDRESERREKEIGGKSFRGRAKVCFVPCVPLSLDTASTSLADIRASPSSVIASTSLSGSGLTVVSAQPTSFSCGRHDRNGQSWEPQYLARGTCTKQAAASTTRARDGSMVASSTYHHVFILWGVGIDLAQRSALLVTPASDNKDVRRDSENEIDKPRQSCKCHQCLCQQEAGHWLGWAQAIIPSTSTLRSALIDQIFSLLSPQPSRHLGGLEQCEVVSCCGTQF